jgi:hypothetical protein
MGRHRRYGPNRATPSATDSGRDRVGAPYRPRRPL